MNVRQKMKSLEGTTAFTKENTKDVPKAQAKQEIKALFDAIHSLDYREIATKTNLRPGLIAHACAELIKEGFTQFADIDESAIPEDDDELIEDLYSLTMVALQNEDKPTLNDVEMTQWLKENELL